MLDLGRLANPEPLVRYLGLVGIPEWSSGSRL